MPKPLSSLPSNIRIDLGNSHNRPTEHHPELGLLAMDVIASYAILETFLASVFVELLGTTPDHAAAIYLALDSQSIKNTALRAVAATTLTELEQLYLEALFSVIKSAGKLRHKLAHWAWGFSPDLPNAVLLGDPRALGKFNLGISKFTTTPEHVDAVKWLQFPRDSVLVYCKADFEDALKSIRRAIVLTSHFRSALNPEWPTGRVGREFGPLSQEPEIREYVARQNERRKIPL
jgi:hypothetical protein